LWINQFPVDVGTQDFDLIPLQFWPLSCHRADHHAAHSLATILQSFAESEFPNVPGFASICSNNLPDNALFSMSFLLMRAQVVI